MEHFILLQDAIWITSIHLIRRFMQIGNGIKTIKERLKESKKAGYGTTKAANHQLVHSFNQKVLLLSIKRTQNSLIKAVICVHCRHLNTICL